MKPDELTAKLHDLDRLSQEDENFCAWFQDRFVPGKTIYATRLNEIEQAFPGYHVIAVTINNGITHRLVPDT
jgi:hypothetical protein